MLTTASKSVPGVPPAGVLAAFVAPKRRWKVVLEFEEEEVPSERDSAIAWSLSYYFLYLPLGLLLAAAVVEIIRRLL